MLRISAQFGRKWKEPQGSETLRGNTEAFSDRIIFFLAKGNASARLKHSAANEAYGEYLALDSEKRAALDGDDFKCYRKLRREWEDTKERHRSAARDLRRYLLTSKTIRQTNWPFAQPPRTVRPAGEWYDEEPWTGVVQAPPRAASASPE